MATEQKSAVILGSNLRRLRQAQKLSQAEIAKRSNLSRVGYRNIEMGTATPKADTLMRLAKALSVGLEDLVRPARELSAVRFRARKKMTSREHLLVEVGRWIDNYSYLEDLLDDRQEFAFHALAQKLQRRKRKPTTPIEAAAEARLAAGLEPGDTIRDICGLLEEKGGVKLFTPQVASEGFFGLSLGPNGDGPAVVVNTWERITVERWIFTAAHELGHILLHHDAFDVDEADENLEEEREADLFASHFLMPDDVFKKELREARGLSLLQVVMKLKAIFRVSWKTVVYRLAQEAGPNGRKIWAGFHAEAKRRFGRTFGPKEEPNALQEDKWYSPSPVLRLADEPENLRSSAFVEDRLSRLVRKAIESEKITMSRGAEILMVSASEMRALTRSWLD